MQLAFCKNPTTKGVTVTTKASVGQPYQLLLSPGKTGWYALVSQEGEEDCRLLCVFSQDFAGESKILWSDNPNEGNCLMRPPFPGDGGNFLVFTSRGLKKAYLYHIEDSEFEGLLARTFQSVVSPEEMLVWYKAGGVASAECDVGL